MPWSSQGGGGTGGGNGGRKGGGPWGQGPWGPQGGGGGGGALAGFGVSFLFSSSVGLSFDLVSRCLASSLPCLSRRNSEGVMSSAEIAGVSGVSGGAECMDSSAHPRSEA